MPNVQAARVSTFDDERDLSLGDGLLNEQETPAGAPHTVTVQTIFRGVGIGAKVLPFPRDVRRSGRSRWPLIAGAALVALALAVFVAVAISLSVERALTGSAAADITFLVGLLGGGALLVAGLAKRRQTAHDGFLVGSVPGVDAPIDPRFADDVPAHPLVAAVGDDWIVNATPHMRGALSVGGQLRSLAELARDGSPSFRLPPGGSARLICGATTFLLSAVPAPARIARPPGWWRRPDAVYVGGAAVAMGLFLLVVFSVPPDPRALSLDLMSDEHHLITFHILPPEEQKTDLVPLPATPGAPGGQSAARAAGQEGAMGRKTSSRRDGAYSTKGPKDNPDQRLAALLRAREAGVLGVIKNLGGPAASVFSHESALGDDAEDAIGALVGTRIGEAAGLEGMGMFGTGSHGGGTGDGLIGLGGPLRTFGHGTGADGAQSGYGRMAGALHRRPGPKAPDILIGDGSVRGSLDKEIIRRIVRRHVNEVKFCYEQELTKQPALAGRIVVQFMISGNGQVLSSVLQSSSMKNTTVERCTVQAVRRWQFPAPMGGGLVTVSYPFSLTPAGG